MATKSKWIVLIIGVFLLVWSLWYPLKQDMWDYMAVTGAIYFTGAFSLLVCGIYWKRASTVGAYASLLCGFGALLGLGPFQTMLGLGAYAGDLTADRVGLATVGASAAAMIAGSLLFPNRKGAMAQAPGMSNRASKVVDK